MLRTVMLAMARTPLIKRVALALPPTRRMVGRFVSGETVEECLAVVRTLTAAGLLVTIDYLGEDTQTLRQADRVTDTYVELLQRLAEAELADSAEVSIKLSALGSQLVDGYASALDNARVICAAAERVGTTVTIDAEDHTTCEATLRTVTELRRRFPWVGAVLQAALYRTPEDCRQLSAAGSRVRLCKGAYAEPRQVAHQRKKQVDLAFRRCTEVLLAGAGYPMFATHDQAMIGHVLSVAGRLGRAPGSFEIQMLHGIRADEQRRLARQGHRVRVYVPFGTDWYAYFMRRLAERPANLFFLLRQLLGR